MKHYDAIVIGSGQAGPAMASQLVKAGQTVAIAEGYRFGGSCVNYGCRPSKVLIASARAAHMARRGADFGVMIPAFSIDWQRVSQRVVDIIEHTSQDIETWLRGIAGLDVYHAYASFDGTTDGLYRVRVGDDVIAAPRIFLNTGTRARMADVPGIDQVRTLNSESLLRLDTLPTHLIIMGGSYIGLEMGQAFRRLGSQVTIIETSEAIIVREDDDIRQEIHRVLTEEGVTILTQHSLTHAEPTEADGVRVRVKHSVTGDEQVISGSHLLSAIGRIPNTDRLNLESVGVQTDARGFVVVDDGLQTTTPNIY
ncbi:MAG: FAD-dependent oxidoreductase, partial [Armatimonadetes bacterium]|nr:FAD-dependent oxidoreductase [Anaerolineae bacterium]